MIIISCGGKHLHIATLMRNIHRVWAHPLALILWCQLLKQFWWMDGRTWKKRFVFFGKSPFGSDGSKLDGYFRTPSGRPSAKKGTLWYAWRKKGLCMFGLYGQIFQGQVVTKIEQCTRMSATQCWDLPSCVQQWKWKSKAGPKIKVRKIGRSQPRHQTWKREPILLKSLLLRLQAAKTKMAPATMSCKLAMWHIYLISTVSAVPPWVNITNMQKQYLIYKKYFRKKCIFSWKTSKIKGRWRVKVYIYIYICIHTMRSHNGNYLHPKFVGKMITVCY